MASTVQQKGSQFPSGPLFIRHSLYWYNLNQIAITARTYQAVQTGGPVFFGDLAKAMQDFMVSAMLPLCSPNTAFIGSKVADAQSPIVHMPGIASDTFTGTAAAADAPKQMASIIKWLTAIGGRSGRGRTFVPFLYAAAISSTGEPTPAYVALLQAFADRWRTIGSPTHLTVGTATFQLIPMLYHKGTGTADTITESPALSLLGGQHRRGDFGKVNPDYIIS